LTYNDHEHGKSNGKASKREIINQNGSAQKYCCSECLSLYRHSGMFLAGMTAREGGNAAVL